MIILISMSYNIYVAGFISLFLFHFFDKFEAYIKVSLMLILYILYYIYEEIKKLRIGNNGN